MWSRRFFFCCRMLKWKCSIWIHLFAFPFLLHTIPSVSAADFNAAQYDVNNGKNDLRMLTFQDTDQKLLFAFSRRVVVWWLQVRFDFIYWIVGCFRAKWGIGTNLWRVRATMYFPVFLFLNWLHWQEMTAISSGVSWKCKRFIEMCFYPVAKQCKLGAARIFRVRVLLRDLWVVIVAPLRTWIWTAYRDVDILTIATKFGIAPFWQAIFPDSGLLGTFSQYSRS